MKKALGWALLIAFCLAIAPVSHASDLETVVKGVKDRYGAISDLKAQFVQETMVKTLDRPQTKSGTVMFKRPGMMRWDYEIPTKQQLLTDGYTLWVYQPEDKVVTMRKLDAVNSAKVPMQILAGELDIKKVFDAKLGGEKDGKILLELAPKEKGAGYEKAVLSLSADTYEIQRIDVVDLYGNVTKLTLSKVTYNNKLKESEFTYAPKPGVRVESEPVME